MGHVVKRDRFFSPFFIEENREDQMEKFEQWLALLSEKRSQDKSYSEHSMKVRKLLQGAIKAEDMFTICRKQEEQRVEKSNERYLRSLTDLQASVEKLMPMLEQLRKGKDVNVRGQMSKVEMCTIMFELATDTKDDAESDIADSEPVVVPQIKLMGVFESVNSRMDSIRDDIKNANKKIKKNKPADDSNTQKQLNSIQQQLNAISEKLDQTPVKKKEPSESNPNINEDLVKRQKMIESKLDTLIVSLSRKRADATRLLTRDLSRCIFETVQTQCAQMKSEVLKAIDEHKPETKPPRVSPEQTVPLEVGMPRDPRQKPHIDQRPTTPLKVDVAKEVNAATSSISPKEPRRSHSRSRSRSRPPQSRSPRRSRSRSRLRSRSRSRSRQREISAKRISVQDLRVNNGESSIELDDSQKVASEWKQMKEGARGGGGGNRTYRIRRDGTNGLKFIGYQHSPVGYSSFTLKHEDSDKLERLFNSRD